LGGAFFPVTDESEFNVVIETPAGSNLAYTQLKTLEIVRYALQKKEVEYTYSTIGGTTENVDEAAIYVRLTPKADRARSQQDVAASLREEISRLAGVTASIATGFANQKQIQLQVQGPDATRLNELAERLMGVVRQVPGAVDVGLSTRAQKPELQIEIDRSLAGSLGVTASQIATALRPAFAGIDVGDWIDPSGETRDVMIRLTPESRMSVMDVASLPLTVAVPDAPPQAIPLAQVAKVSTGKGPARIDHLNTGRVITVQANTQERPLSEVIADINSRLTSF
jgi:HAE1 family hydrophobic/amphiphilic exporter-1